MKRIGIYTTAAAGALAAIYLTLTVGPQPKGSQCIGILARGDDPDGGRSYARVTVASDPGDASVVDWLLDRAENKGWEVVGIATLDAGFCSAQPNAVRIRWATRTEPLGCTCDSDGGAVPIPCATFAGDKHRTVDWGCFADSNAAEVP